MYINPFVAGVIATVLAEIVALVVYVVVKGGSHNGKK